MVFFLNFIFLMGPLLLCVPRLFPRLYQSPVIQPLNSPKATSSAPSPCLSPGLITSLLVSQLSASCLLSPTWTCLSRSMVQPDSFIHVHPLLTHLPWLPTAHSAHPTACSFSFQPLFFFLLCFSKWLICFLQCWTWEVRGLWSGRVGVKTKCLKLCFFRQIKWQQNQCSVGFTKCFLCEYHFSGGVILVYLVNASITLFAKYQ